MHFAESQVPLRFLLLLYFRNFYLLKWLISSRNSCVPLPSNADFLLNPFSPCFTFVFTGTKYSIWDTFISSTESWGLRCIIWYSIIRRKMCKYVFMCLYVYCLNVLPWVPFSLCSLNYLKACPHISIYVVLHLHR